MSDVMVYLTDPDEYGPGKCCIVDDEQNETLCGRCLSVMPGTIGTEGVEYLLGRKGKGYCGICFNRYAGRFEPEPRKREWWRKYNAYLLSDAWRTKRALVLERSGYNCEGCGAVRACQVHHLTYAHVGNEFLWELKAVCNACHERLHEVAK